MTQSLTQAGLDPSNIEERAKLIATVRKGVAAVAGGKRKRGGDDDEAMDVDGEGAGGAWEDVDGMDVDEGEGSRRKRAKGASGAAVVKGKRDARKDRSTAGMRDARVSLSSAHSDQPNILSGYRLRRSLSFFFFPAPSGFGPLQQVEQAKKLKHLSQRGPNLMARAGEADRSIRVKMPKREFFLPILRPGLCITLLRFVADMAGDSLLRIDLFSGKRKSGKTNRR